MRKIIARLIGLYLNLLAIISPGAAGKKGFYLFCTPHRVPVKDYQRKFLDTAEKSRFYCDGATIQVYRWGNGPKKILLLHGWQSHSFRWKSYIESFSKEEFTLYALDAPGHGLSGGKYLNLVIYSNVIEAFVYSLESAHTIVSHSIGSFSALYTFFRVPSLPVKQLVIMGTPAEVSTYVQFYKKTLHLSGKMTQAIDASFMKFIHHLPSYYSAAKFAEAVSIPVLNIHDEQDAETPYAQAVEINNAFRNSTLITTSGLGHNLRSASVVKHVMDFASQTTKSQKSEMSLSILDNFN